MAHPDYLTLGLSLAYPLAPLVLSFLLMRRALKAKKTSILAIGAAGMTQVLSLMWLLNAVVRLPVFFEPASPQLTAWVAVNYNAAPYLSFSFALLSGSFWLVLRRGQQAGAPTSSASPATSPAGNGNAEARTPARLPDATRHAAPAPLPASPVADEADAYAANRAGRRARQRAAKRGTRPLRRPGVR